MAVGWLQPPIDDGVDGPRGIPRVGREGCHAAAMGNKEAARRLSVILPFYCDVPDSVL